MSTRRHRRDSCPNRPGERRIREPRRGCGARPSTRLPDAQHVREQTRARHVRSLARATAADLLTFLLTFGARQGPFARVSDRFRPRSGQRPTATGIDAPPKKGPFFGGKGPDECRTVRLQVGQLRRPGARPVHQSYAYYGSGPRRQMRRYVRDVGGSGIGRSTKSVPGRRPENHSLLFFAHEACGRQAPGVAGGVALGGDPRRPASPCAAPAPAVRSRRAGRAGTTRRPRSARELLTAAPNAIGSKGPTP